MIDLNTPIYSTPALDKEIDRKAMIAVLDEGRAARRAGLPKTPPPFRDLDMAVDWAMGWRWQDEEMKAREL